MTAHAHKTDVVAAGCRPCIARTHVASLLQDVHWSAGLFGYFPTYSLGAMYACQIYAHAKQQLPDLEQQAAAGNFKPLKVRLLRLLASVRRCTIQRQSDVGASALM
eukprot:GHRQ01029285.1.p4 GENE.GHRQ01029285.1~~GHRQ01029285.1.p4  ORF type:complete len:106 (-),score=33.13 GHRQ01029285.1:248-565(-)